MREIKRQYRISGVNLGTARENPFSPCRRRGKRNKRQYRDVFVFSCLVVACVMPIFMSGCDAIRIFPAEPPPPEVVSKDQSIIEEAYCRYEIGDFENAAVLFEQLSGDSEDSGIRQRALYGLACSRLVLAENDEALDLAIRIWNMWSLSCPDNLADHDPRMLGPLVQRIVVNGFVEPQIAHTRSEGPLPVSDDFPAETVDFAADVPEEDAQTCETKLADSETQIRAMEKKLNRMRRRIRNLKKQIESLETIHRTIQEKKKEFYYP